MGLHSVSVGIYAGQETSDNIATLRARFEKVLPQGSKISDLQPIDFKSTNSLQGLDLLVMPGGACSQWDQDLGQEGKKAIRNFVLCMGGSYLGTCAGAAFACRKVFYQTSSIKIVKEREIAFFEGEAKGPISEKPFMVPIIWGKGSKGYFFNLGGFYFTQKGEGKEPGSQGAEQEGTEAPPAKCEAIARYEDGEAAALRISIGKGQVFLLGCHFSYFEENMPPDRVLRQYGLSSEEMSELKANLRKSEEFRLACFREILKVLFPESLN